jgi:hypothetical protein
MMKRLNYLMSAAASLMLAAGAMTSCSSVDNPSGDTPTPQPEQQEAKLIIKEIAVSGGFKTTEGKSYNWCKAMMLYNNGGAEAKVKNLAIGTIPPGNAHANNGNYTEDGKLNYEDADFIPMIYGIWYLPTELTVAPYSDVVIAINGAIDHTATAPDAYNLADASFHAMYDPESPYVNANAYPAPFEGIPAEHYWKAAVFGLGNAWAISVMCPNLVLFQFPEGVDPEAYCADKANSWFDGGKETDANYCVKIPKAWVIDGVETYRLTMVDDSKKRVPASIDAGYALYNSNKMYSAYRNVDQAATEAIAENSGKLVYGYDQAVEGTAEPSGIDAAASIKNGAKIVYQDTNNSTADFHLRATWSLK